MQGSELEKKLHRDCSGDVQRSPSSTWVFADLCMHERDPLPTEERSSEISRLGCLGGSDS